jgi:hypothetical protein
MNRNPEFNPGPTSLPDAGLQETPEPNLNDEAPASEPGAAKPVERLFPFVLRARLLVVGRDSLHAHKGKLHFVLITRDIAEEHREEVLKDFRHYPVVQHFMAADLETFFHIKGARAIGFMKSGLAQSIYAELKAHRINKPFLPPKPPENVPPARKTKRSPDRPDDQRPV